MDRPGKTWGFLKTLLVIVLLGIVTVAAVRWYLSPRQGVPPPIPTPVAGFSGDPVEATEKLRKALDGRLQEMGLLKLMDQEVESKPATVQEKVVSTYRERFRLPRLYSPEELATRLEDAAKPLGAGLSGKTSGTTPDNSATLYSYSFAYNNQWNPVQVEFVDTHKPRVCLVIDDGGYQRGEALEHLYGFKVPVTLALIPSTEFSRELAREAPSHGVEIICHMPMEGREKFPKGAYPELLKRGMATPELKKRIDRALEALPGCEGMNNHMGSLATADASLMSAFCQALKNRKLFVLDSRTTVETDLEGEAAKIHLARTRRDIFLDNTETPEAIQKQLNKLVALAKKRGVAVGIGHFKLVSLRALEEAVHQLRDQGIQFVYLSEVVKE